MSGIVTSGFIVLLLLQFFLWVGMEIDVKRSENGDLRWFAAAGIFPVIGLGVSLWYVLNRRDLRDTSDGR